MHADVPSARAPKSASGTLRALGQSGLAASFLGLAFISGDIAASALAAPALAASALMILFAAAASKVVDPIARVERRGDDRASLAILSIVLIGELFASTLDTGRFHILDGLPMNPPMSLQWIAVFVLGVGYSLRLSAMHENVFFTNLILVQSERSHRVIQSGPYRLVRHPGYASILLILASVAIAFGSLLPVPLAAIGGIAVLRRTTREDLFLLDNLPGYREYAARTPFRLIPGIY